ncbi:MAG TPA: ATP-binding protein [Actinomycetota bacterium]|nr:ATP-binding protein [Actinomycetota bacterium]
MTAKVARSLAWGLFGLSVVLIAWGLLLESEIAPGDEDIVFIYGGIGLVIGYGGVGALIASRQPRNPIGWLFCGIAFIFAVTAFSDEFVTRGLVTGSPTMVVPLAWLSSWIFVAALVAVPLVLLLFPDGRPPSPRWRPVLWATIGAGVMAAFGFIIAPGSLEAPDPYHVANPTAMPSLVPLPSILLTVGGFGSLAAGLASLAALIIRFRRSSGDERQQIRWLAYVGLAGVVVLGATIATWEGGTLNNVLFFLFFLVLAIGIPAATGIAILKHRLYEVDVVVRRTLIFSALAVFITVVYVAVVVVIGTQATDSLVPSLIATALVAALIQPIRRRVTRLANRLVFGKRAEPYEVLARFSDRVGAAYDASDVLPRTARMIAEGTGANRVEVWLGPGEAHLAAAWPPDGQPVAGAHIDRDIRHQEERLGEIRVWTAPGHPLRPAEEKLLTDLASQTGLVVRNLSLDDELRRRVDELSVRARELQESRMRIVQAHDAERRRLERNIHDGAQQHLVALAVKLRLVGATAARDPKSAVDQLTQLRDQTDLALTTLLDLASGIYPAVLEEQGVGAALITQGKATGVPLSVDSDGVGRLPIEIEAAIYFVCLEAMQNAAKYARATTMRVRLTRDDDGLAFHVEDDGIGFDAAKTQSGTGLQNMRDRLAACGGDVAITSSLGAGTTVSGRLRVPERVGS